MDRVRGKSTKSYVYIIYRIYFESTIYFRCGKYDPVFMIVPRLDKVLAKGKAYLYRLAKETRCQSHNSVAIKKGQGSWN